MGTPNGADSAAPLDAGGDASTLDGSNAADAPSDGSNAADTQSDRSNAADTQSDQLAPTPLGAMTIRLERPYVVRGPAGDEMDQPLSELALGAGSWRAFTANATSFAVDAPDMLSLGGTRTAVLSPGAKGTYSECGQWLNEARVIGGTLFGFVHCEMACNYAVGQTHKSMAIARSTDQGHTWTMLAQFMTDTQPPQPNTITGEGDCTAIDGHDGYVYAYCLRDMDWTTIVARAQASDLSPGNWWKFDGTGWSLPALGGHAAALGGLGTGSAYWTTEDAVMLAQPNHAFGGVELSLSSNRTAFTTFPEPLVPLEADDWSRPAPTELYAYVSFLSPLDGTNDVGDDLYLAHVYLQPNEDFGSRYYVMRHMKITRLASDPGAPRVGVALVRWYSSADHDRWTTTAPVPGNDTRYVVDASVGYLMSAPPPNAQTTKLEDCVSTWPGHPDHVLTNDGQCVGGGYTRLRTAGWVFQSAVAGTAPLYRCFDPIENSHFASNQPNCDGLGRMEWLLGYALSR